MELVRTAATMLAAALLASPQAASQQDEGYTRATQSRMRSAPTQGLQHLKLGERSVDVYMKRPAGEGTWPGVVLLHDAMGLNPDMTRIADRLALEGFVVVAPDMYGGRFALDADKGRELSVLMDREAALANIEALTAHLKYLKEVGDHRVGWIGFDVGGVLALKGAMGSQDISALVVACGRPETDADSLRRIGCPILGLFGGRDESFPSAETLAFRSALAAAGRAAQVKVYDGAGHGFMKEEDPAYKADDALDAWKRMVAFLRENL